MNRFFDSNVEPLSYPSSYQNYLNIVVLYPSLDTATVDKCYKIGVANGYTKTVVSYIFSEEAQSPEHVLLIPNKDVEWANAHLKKLAENSKQVILAWGGYGEHKNRGAEVLNLFSHIEDKLYVLGYTKTGQPAHPLKIKYNQPLVKYDGRRNPT